MPVRKKQTKEIFTVLLLYIVEGREINGSLGFKSKKYFVTFACEQDTRGPLSFQCNLPFCSTYT